MLKTGLIFFMLLFSCGSAVFSEEPKLDASSVAAVSVSSFTWRALENKAFSQDEKLTYSIHWGLITAGLAEMNIDGIDNIGDRKAYHIVTISKSLPFFDVFYRVDNKDESWIDVESICSLKYEKHQKEGGYRKEEYLSLDNESGKFRLKEKHNNGTVTDKEGKMPEFAQDILSGLYLVRTKKLHVGDEFLFDVQAGEKVYPMKVTVLRKERIKVPVGKFDCFVVEPTIAGNVGLFVVKGQLWIWLTDDDRKIPVYMRSKVYIGTVWADLVKMKF